MMQNSYKTLTEIFNDELNKLSLDYKSIEEFIFEDEKSANFIKEVTKDAYINEVSDNKSVFDFRETCARHIGITYLYGLSLFDFAKKNVFDLQESNLEKDDSKNRNIWLIIALYHDMAYYSEYLSKGDLVYSEIGLKNNLFENEKDFNDLIQGTKNILAFDYSEIMQYDRFARKYHINKKLKNEALDHGILGAILSYNKLMNKANGSESYEQLKYEILVACLTIAQQNFYRPSVPEDDLLYGDNRRPDKLFYNSLFKISKSTPYLLFLSLVDTIECVKKYCKSNNKYNYFETKTVLDSISILVEDNCISIDYTELEKKIKDKNKNDRNKDVQLESFKDIVSSLKDWTIFKITQKKDLSIIEISV